ncbi:MAG: response regulator transcription factor [Pseudomonadota bacterium]
MILLASSSQEVLELWARGVHSFAQVSRTSGLAELRNELLRTKPQMLLLDHQLPELGGTRGVSALIKLSPETTIIILSGPLSDETEWELFKTGVRGCCPRDIEPQQLASVVQAVQKGELWIRRTLTRRLLNELWAIALEKNNIKQAASDLLSNLTRREHEIAKLIGNGESNKQIAQRLDITERTVKAHLTEIFRKLDVRDRLKLALLVTGSKSSDGQPRTDASGRTPIVS